MIPDITTHNQPQHQIPLDWVGMRNVQLPVKTENLLLPATSDILVNLHDQKAKGIHMSRLYLSAKEAFEGSNISFEVLEALAQKCIETHKEISDQALINVHFELPRKTKALLSDNTGWRYYPMTLSCHATKEETTFQVEFELLYSSTCPCSAALSRQSLKDRFEQHFPQKEVHRGEVSAWIMDEHNQTATPHSQRSRALVSLEVGKSADFRDIESFIEVGEHALQTVVQGAVKRVDEQKFAELNAQNMMFSEDAARKLQNAYEPIKNILDYHIEVQHLESLHPHDAVAVVTKK